MSFELKNRAVEFVRVHRYPVLLLVAILTYTAVLSYVSILKHNLFLTTAWDLGIYEQSIWSTVNAGRFFWYTIELPVNPSGCFFGIHFSPVLFLVLPIYKLFQSTATLLILQSLVVSLGVVPLYLIGVHEMKNRDYALFFCFLYLIYPPLLGLNLFDFHTQAFVPLFFFSAFYFFVKRKFVPYFVFVILALSIVEFVPFLVVFLGLYAFWVGWKEIKNSGKSFNYWLLFRGTMAVAISTVVLAFSWYVVARMALFYFNPAVLPNRNWAQLGDPVHNPLGLLWNAVTNPVLTFQLVFSSAGEKLTYLFGVLAPVGLLSFLDIPSLLIGAPWFLAAFLSNYLPYFTVIGYQYVAFVIPFVFISAVRGTRKLPHLKERFAFVRKFSTSFGNRQKQVLAGFYVSVLIVSCGLIFYQPHLSFLAARMSLHSEQHLSALNGLLALVPADASILTQNDIMPHASQRMYSYAMWEWNASSSAGSVDAVDFFLQNVSPDYVLIDTTSSWYLDNIEQYTKVLIENRSYRIYSSTDYVWLLKKGYEGNTVNLFENGFSTSLYNQGLMMNVYNGSLPSGALLLNESMLNVSVPSGLLSALSPYRSSASLTVTWDGSLFVPVDGSYNFYVLSNSSSPRKLQIDNQVVLASQETSADLALAVGFHNLQFEYEMGDSNETLFLFWEPPWDTTPDVLGSSFLYPSETPVVSSTVFAPTFGFGYMSPFPTINRDFFSSFLNGSFTAETSGTYVFRALADNDTLVYIDGSLVYNSYVSNSNGLFDVELGSGEHQIYIVYVELTGDASLAFQWMPPGQLAFEEFP
jgi:uncharacterized membrane protein